MDKHKEQKAYNPFDSVYDPKHQQYTTLSDPISPHPPPHPGDLPASPKNPSLGNFFVLLVLILLVSARTRFF